LRAFDTGAMPAIITPEPAWLVPAFGVSEKEHA
jgi:hypothetical protein